MQKPRKVLKNSESARRVRYYDFGPFRVDVIKRLLLRDGMPIALTPKAFEVLAVLVGNRGEVLLKEELIETVWPNTVVEEGNLNRNISTLRRALGESPGDHAYVVTVPRRGYRFVGEVGEVCDERPPDEPIESLAVLPLLNLSGDPGQEYFADGLTEALITDLAQIRALRVVSRTSVMRYRNTPMSLRDIARELGVDVVVEGSVMRADQRVRITVQLIQGRTDRHLWANTYEGELGDVLGVQRALARAIVREIRAALTPAEQARLAAARVVSPKAHEAYLKGRYFWNQRTSESLSRSVGFLEEAIREDHGYALAHVALAQAYAIMIDYGFQSPRALVPKAMQIVQRALDLDGDLGEAHATLALLTLIHDWDFRGAEERFRHALDLNHGDPTTHQWYGVLLMYQRRFDESLQQMQMALELDPLAPIIRAALALDYVLAGRYNEGIVQAEGVLDLEPKSGQAYAVLGMAGQQEGAHDQAISSFRHYLELSGRDSDALMRWGCACAQSGDVDTARKVRDELRTRSTERYVSPGHLAALEFALGNTERALAELDAGLEQRDTSMLLLAVDPVFAGLRPNLRFQALLRRIGLPA